MTLTHLQLNTLDALSKTAGHLYLELFDAWEGHKSPENEQRAFFAACEYEDRFGSFVDAVMRSNPVHRFDDRTFSDLSIFFAKRWRNNFMEGWA